MMSEPEARERICAVGRALWLQGMAAANDGNISVRVGADRVLCTPAGVAKAELSPDLLVTVDLEGTPIGQASGGSTGRADEPRPSSEILMHVRLYQLDHSVGAVVHAHPPYATVFAISGEALTAPLTAETVVLMPEVPVARYGMPSTHEVPDSVAPFARTHRACLLEHHGALSWGGDLTEAHHRMERLEHTAKVTHLARQIGAERPLPPSEVERLRQHFGDSSVG